MDNRDSQVRVDCCYFLLYNAVSVRKMNRNQAYKINCQIINQRMTKASTTIGYYPIRGKAQVCRLICEYLKVDYSDKLFSIPEWEKEKKQKLKNYSIKELPYFQEGNFRITGSIPMCLYVIDRFSNGQLLGKDMKHQALVDMYLWTIDAMSGIININCQKKSEDQIKQFKEYQWRNAVVPKLQKYQEAAKENQWFLGYLTIIDFSIYELVRYMELIFCQKVSEFPKLIAISRKILELPEIRSYERSDRAIRQMCPTTLLKQLKEQKRDEGSKSK